MTPKEKIAKLEGLLGRIKERAEAPRPIAAVAIAPEPAYAQPAVRKAASVAPASKVSTPPPPDSSGWSEPPPAEAAEAAPESDAVVSTEMVDYEDDDVDVTSEVVEMEIDVDEPGGSAPAMPAESGSHLAAERVTVEATEIEIGAETDLDPQELDDTLVGTVGGAGAPRDLGEAAAPPPANELIEPEPSSSPRPIINETPDGYEEESAPRHTPPPESGKQVAVPSVKPEARKSTAPPPSSLEGHTMLGVGGGNAWRAPEPPPATVVEPRAPSVRPPPPPPPPPPPAEARRSVRPAAEITAPSFPETVQIATIEGTSPTFKPATFGELIDASLSL